MADTSAGSRSARDRRSFPTSRSESRRRRGSPTRELHDAQRTVTAARAQLRRLVAPGTIVALPSAPSIAPLIEGHGASVDSFRIRCLRLTCIAGVGGLPQVSIPAGLVEGCPVGLSLIGWAGGDERLLELAVALAPRCGVVKG